MKKLLAALLLASGLAIYSPQLRAEGSDVTHSPKQEVNVIARLAPEGHQETIRRLNDTMQKELRKSPQYRGVFPKKDAYKGYERAPIKLNAGKEFKNEEGLVAKLGTSLAIDEFSRVTAVGFSGEKGKASIAVNYDLRKNQNIIQGSFKGKDKGIELVIRDYKEPVIKAYAPLAKGVNIGVIADPVKHYFAANMGAGYKGVNLTLKNESLVNATRTTTNLTYTIPKEYNHFLTSIAWTHASYNHRLNNRNSNIIQANGKIGLVNINLSLDNLANPREYKPAIRLSYSKKF